MEPLVRSLILFFSVCSGQQVHLYFWAIYCFFHYFFNGNWRFQCLMILKYTLFASPKSPPQHFWTRRTKKCYTIQQNGLPGHPGLDDACLHQVRGAVGTGFNSSSLSLDFHESIPNPSPGSLGRSPELEKARQVKYLGLSRGSSTPVLRIKEVRVGSICQKFTWPGQNRFQTRLLF